MELMSDFEAREERLERLHGGTSSVLNVSVVFVNSKNEFNSFFVVCLFRHI